jgi:hypothetical protein
VPTPSIESQNRASRVGPTHPFRKWVIAGVLGIVPILCCAAILFLNAAIDGCRPTTEIRNLLGVIPAVPLPLDVVRLSERDASGKPFVRFGGSQQALYGEIYSTLVPPETVVTFYEGQGAVCTSQGHPLTAHWRCELGYGWVDVFAGPADLAATPDPFIHSYHLNGPLPHDHTILRTFVNWCDDL